MTMEMGFKVGSVGAVENIVLDDGTVVVRWTITVPGHEATGETPSTMVSIDQMDTALMDAGLNPCAWAYFERWACGA